MNREFKVPAANHTSDQPLDALQKGLDVLVQSVLRLKEETNDLERLKALATIHCQQNESDLATLRTIYKSFKARLEVLSQPAPSVPPPVFPQKSGIKWSATASDSFFKQPHVRLRYALTLETILCAVRFNSDGSQIAFADGKLIFFVNSADGSVAATCEIPRGGEPPGDSLPRCLCFSPDSKFLIVGGQTSATIAINVAQRQVVKILDIPGHVVSTIGFIQDGRMVTGGFDGKLCIWSVPGFDLIRVIQHGTEGKLTKDEMVVAVAVDEDFIGVGFMSGTIGIYEPSFTQPMISFHAHNEFLLNLIISRAGMMATASHDKTAKLWVIRGVASCKQTLQGHGDYVLAIAFPPRDPVVFTGSKDETIKCWNQKTGDLLFTINGHKNTLFQIDHHPTERTIVSCGGDGLVCVWEYDLPA
jgi:WD40 repeat protein